MSRLGRRARCRLLIALSATAFIACDAGAPADAGYVARDSAGVAIVDNASPDWRDTGRLIVEPEPAVRIGAVDGPAEQQLLSVTDATRLTDGRIVIANSGASDIRFFDASGAHIRSVGRAGAGPGEFQSPRWLAARADTIVVYDPFQDNGRLTFLDLDGDYIGDQRIAVKGLSFPGPDAMLPDGSLLDQVSEGSIGPGEVGYVRYTRMPIRYPRTGEFIDTIAVAPGSETFRAPLGNGIAQREVPFGSGSYTALSDDRVYVGNGDGFIIDAYSFDGTHLVSIRAAHEPLAVTQQLKDRWIDVMLSNPGYQARPDAAQRARDMYRAAPMPQTARAYSALEVDAAGRLWVQLFAPPWDDANVWSVFDPNGRWLGDVELPSGLQILEIGDDYVLGRTTDALDVEFVQLHRLRVERS